MDKIITLKGNGGAEYEIKLRSSAGSLIHYKNQFKSDGLADLVKMERMGLEDYNSSIICQFLWAFAYSYDKSIPPLAEWLDGFDIAPLDFVSQVADPVIALLGYEVENETSKKK